MLLLSPPAASGLAPTKGSTMAEQAIMAEEMKPQKKLRLQIVNILTKKTQNGRRRTRAASKRTKG